MSEAGLKKFRSFLILVLFTYLASAFALCYALPFIIVPKAGVPFPSRIIDGSQVYAYYTVYNNTILPRANNYVKYLPPNVSQVTSGGTYGDTCGALFNLAAKNPSHTGDNCTLQLNITGPVDPHDPDPHHHLFVCFPAGMTCAGPSSNVGQLNVARVNLTLLTVTPATATINFTSVPPQHASIHCFRYFIRWFNHGFNRFGDLE